MIGTVRDLRRSRVADTAGRCRTAANETAIEITHVLPVRGASLRDTPPAVLGAPSGTVTWTTVWSGDGIEPELSAWEPYKIACSPRPDAGQYGTEWPGVTAEGLA